MQKKSTIQLEKPFVFTLSEMVVREPQTDEEREDYPDGIQEVTTSTYSARMPFGRNAQELFSGVVGDILNVYYSPDLAEFRTVFIAAFDKMGMPKIVINEKGEEVEDESIAGMIEPFVPVLSRLDAFIDVILPYTTHFTTVEDPNRFNNALPLEIWNGLIGSMIWIYKQMVRTGMIEALKKSVSGLITPRKEAMEAAQKEMMRVLTR